MKRLIVLYTVLAIFSPTIAQVKIGNNPSVINAGSILELEATDKGLLISRVTLTASNVWGLTGTAVAGMIVYNTVNAGVSPNNVVANNFYFWNGAFWTALASVSQLNNLGIPKVVLAASSTSSQTLTNNQVAVLNFPIVSTNDGNWNSATNTYTVPTGGDGIYQITTASQLSINTGINIVGIQVQINSLAPYIVNGLTNVTVPLGISGSMTVRLVAGDQIKIQGYTCVSSCTATLYDFNAKTVVIEKKSN